MGSSETKGLPMNVREQTEQQTGSSVATINGLYARFYAPTVILMIAMSVLPYHVSEPGQVHVYRNIWQLVVAPHVSDAEGLSMLVMVALIALVTIAALEKLRLSGLLVMAACALVLAVVLWNPAGYQGKPLLTSAGVIQIVFGFLIAATALVHSAHRCVAVCAGAR